MAAVPAAMPAAAAAAETAETAAAEAVEVGLGEAVEVGVEVREAIFFMAAAGEAAAGTRVRERDASACMRRHQASALATVGARVTHAGPRRWPTVHAAVPMVVRGRAGRLVDKSDLRSVVNTLAVIVVSRMLDVVGLS